MPILAVVALVLLFFAALGSSWWWRGPAGTAWYGDACFHWGVFFLALILMWPIIEPLMGKGLR
jgi:hypothetical protein